MIDLARVVFTAVFFFSFISHTHANEYNPAQAGEATRDVRQKAEVTREASEAGIDARPLAHEAGEAAQDAREAGASGAALARAQQQAVGAQEQVEASAGIVDLESATQGGICEQRAGEGDCATGTEGESLARAEPVRSASQASRAVSNSPGCGGLTPEDLEKLELFKQELAAWQLARAKVPAEKRGELEADFKAWMQSTFGSFKPELRQSIVAEFYQDQARKSLEVVQSNKSLSHLYNLYVKTWQEHEQALRDAQGFRGVAGQVLRIGVGAVGIGDGKMPYEKTLDKLTGIEKELDDYLDPRSGISKPILYPPQGADAATVELVRQQDAEIRKQFRNNLNRFRIERHSLAVSQYEALGADIAKAQLGTAAVAGTALIVAGFAVPGALPAGASLLAQVGAAAIGGGAFVGGTVAAKGAIEASYLGLTDPTTKDFFCAVAKTRPLDNLGKELAIGMAAGAGLSVGIVVAAPVVGATVVGTAGVTGRVATAAGASRVASAAAAVAARAAGIQTTARVVSGIAGIGVGGYFATKANIRVYELYTQRRETLRQAERARILGNCSDYNLLLEQARQLTAKLIAEGADALLNDFLIVHGVHRALAGETKPGQAPRVDKNKPLDPAKVEAAIAEVNEAEAKALLASNPRPSKTIGPDPSAPASPAPEKPLAKRIGPETPRQDLLAKYGQEVSRIPEGDKVARARSFLDVLRREIGRLREFTQEQIDGLQRAHEIGKGETGLDGKTPARIGNYTRAQIRAKYVELLKAGFSAEEAELALRTGFAGEARTVAQASSAGRSKSSETQFGDDVVVDRAVAEALKPQAIKVPTGILATIQKLLGTEGVDSYRHLFDDGSLKFIEGRLVVDWPKLIARYPSEGSRKGLQELEKALDDKDLKGFEGALRSLDLYSPDIPSRQRARAIEQEIPSIVQEATEGYIGTTEKFGRREITRTTRSNGDIVSIARGAKGTPHELEIIEAVKDPKTGRYSARYSSKGHSETMCMRCHSVNPVSGAIFTMEKTILGTPEALPGKALPKDIESKARKVAQEEPRRTPTTASSSIAAYQAELARLESFSLESVGYNQPAQQKKFILDALDLRKRMLKHFIENPGISVEEQAKKIDASAFLETIDFFVKQLERARADLEKQPRIGKDGKDIITPQLKNLDIILNQARQALKEGKISYYDLMALENQYTRQNWITDVPIDPSTRKIKIVEIIDTRSSKGENPSKTADLRLFPLAIDIPIYIDINHVDLALMDLLRVNPIGLLEYGKTLMVDGIAMDRVAFAQHDRAHRQLYFYKDYKANSAPLVNPEIVSLEVRKVNLRARIYRRIFGGTGVLDGGDRGPRGPPLIDWIKETVFKFEDYHKAIAENRPTKSNPMYDEIRQKDPKFFDELMKLAKTLKEPFPTNPGDKQRRYQEIFSILFNESFKRLEPSRAEQSLSQARLNELIRLVWFFETHESDKVLMDALTKRLKGESVLFNLDTIRERIISAILPRLHRPDDVSGLVSSPETVTADQLMRAYEEILKAINQEKPE